VIHNSTEIWVAQLNHPHFGNNIIVYKEKFAKNLKELIEADGVTKFARKVRIPQQTLSNYLLCQSEIGLENLVKIADYFSESIDVLIGRKEY